MKLLNLHQIVERPRLIQHVDRLHAWKHGECFAPVSIDFTPMSSCNQSCSYCFSAEMMDSVQGDDRKIDTQVMIDLFRDAGRYGVDQMFIEGIGEPLMHPDLHLGIQAGHAEGLDSMIVTNGVLLRPERQEQILPYLWALRMSVVTRDPKRYARLHGCSEKQWHVLIENIRSLVELRNSNDLSCVLWATAYLFDGEPERLYEDIEFIRELGFDIVNVGQIDESPFGAEKDKPRSAYGIDLVPGGAQRLKSLEREDFYIQLRLKGTQSRDLCYVQQQHEKTDRDCQGIYFKTCVASDGHVYPCHAHLYNKDYSLGNLAEMSFQEIWERRHRESVMQRVNAEGYDPKRCFCFHAHLNTTLKQIENPTKFAHLV
jgi:cyclic pyranopterin phosphate synthase